MRTIRFALGWKPNLGAQSASEGRDKEKVTGSWTWSSLDLYVDNQCYDFALQDKENRGGTCCPRTRIFAQMNALHIPENGSHEVAVPSKHRITYWARRRAWTRPAVIKMLVSWEAR